ncbi:MAG: radical SAM protein [Sedimentisphaerales bacterium]|jgi:MoaA/NifB/PqqE/SkfB family radical SAM enzyme
MKQIFFGVRYIVNRRMLGRNTPLIAGLAITNRCNLRCRHCRVPERGTDDMSFEEAITILNSFYREGGRTVYIEGGEPFIWHDGRYGLNNIVRNAHRTGFITVVVYTNGTMPLDTSADTVFISIDGLQKTHDFLRGETFVRIMQNVRESSHPSLYVNYTINNYNKNEIEEFCEHINAVHQIRGIFFYFHTPYYGYDDLYIEPAERNDILLRLLAGKKKYKILNSRAGLKSALYNDWKRPLDICRVYEKGAVYECCRFSGDPELCRNCGYLSYAEIHQTLRLKPSAVLNALRYF